MAPSATGDGQPLSRREAWKLLPEPTIHPVKEVRFEKYITPQKDGYETAKSRPAGDAAIVIDYGNENSNFSVAPMEDVK